MVILESELHTAIAIAPSPDSLTMKPCGTSARTSSATATSSSQFADRILVNIALTPRALDLQEAADKSDQRKSIHNPIATMARFSDSETKPSGTLAPPPTQAHLMDRCCT